VSKAFEKVKRFIEQHAMFDHARGVVVAVSGGPDSVALLDLLMRWREAEKREGAATGHLHVAHLNHQLRGPESDEDAEFVRRLAARLGLPITIESTDVRAAAASSQRGIEETAREIRYRFLLDVARATNCDRIATGHTMSDQAETFLLRLARGAGLRGLAAMRPVSAVPAHDAATVPLDRFNRVGTATRDERPIAETPNSPFAASPCPRVPASPQLIRPLLAITREEIELYCCERGLEFRTDATNLSGDYTRNRVRRDVLPHLRAINPRIVEAIARTTEIIAADEDALDHLAALFLDQARVASAGEGQITQASGDEGLAYSVDAILKQPVGLRRRMLIEAIKRARIAANQTASGELTATHIAAVEPLLDAGTSGHRLTLPDGLEVWREFDAIVFRVVADDASGVKYEVALSRQHARVEAGGLMLMLERGKPFHLLESLLEQARREKQTSQRDWLIVVLDDGLLPSRLLVRPRRAGERAHVCGQQKIKKLKNLMIGHKIPFSRRNHWPVVTTPDDRYIWSPGLPPALEFTACDETEGLAILRAATIRSIRQEP
jgi:tRNA(Ile)-lysidine synthase